MQLRLTSVESGARHCLRVAIFRRATRWRPVNRPGPKRVVVYTGEHPVLDRWEVPCSCSHDYDSHTRYGWRCKAADSYGCQCECPSYEADENIINDLTIDEGSSNP